MGPWGHDVMLVADCTFVILDTLTLHIQTLSHNQLNKLNFRQRVSLCWLLHLILQYLMPHRRQVYMPSRPHTEQNFLGGISDAAALIEW